MTPKTLDDALHVAHATVAGLDIVLSWNMRHIARASRQKKIQAVNLLNGYDKPIALITPMEVVYELGA